MKIQCSCGHFQAEIQKFPKDTPGRAICYCDDCQTFLHFLDRPELLDFAGGTEIIPVYPANFKILKGQETLKCIRLSPKGLYRWATSCCNTPVGNVVPGFPWLGLPGVVFKANGPDSLDEVLGAVRCRINGRFATQNPPPGTSEKTSFKDLKVIFPFVLKGFLTGKGRPSPYFDKDKNPVVTPYVLSLEERLKNQPKNKN